MRGAPPDPWAVLGLPGTATVAQAERAYRRLARHHHPDAVGGTKADRAQAAARMATLNAAIAAIRAGSPAAEAGQGWWQGAPPDDAHDWFGFPFEAEGRGPSDGTSPEGAGEGHGATEGDHGGAPPPVPTTCPACEAPVADLDDLRAHLRDAHGIGAHRRRPVVRVLDRLDALAWRLPARFLVVLAALVGFAVLAWLRDVLPLDHDARPLVDIGSGTRLGLVLFVIGPALVTALVLWALNDRHRHRIEVADRLRRRQAFAGAPTSPPDGPGGRPDGPRQAQRRPGGGRG